MAANDNEYRYATNLTYGNVAYDFIPLDNTAPAYEPEPEYDIQPVPEIRAHKAKAAVEETKQGLSIVSMLGFLAVTALLIMVLMSYVQLNAIRSESSALRRELNTLEDDAARLSVKYESAFDMTAVEDYARNVLGMVPISEAQRTQLENVRPDKAVILSENGVKGGGILSSVLTSIVEYFR